MMIRTTCMRHQGVWEVNGRVISGDLNCAAWPGLRATSLQITGWTGNASTTQTDERPQKSVKTEAWENVVDRQVPHHLRAGRKEYSESYMILQYVTPTKVQGYVGQSSHLICGQVRCIYNHVTQSECLVKQGAYIQTPDVSRRYTVRLRGIVLSILDG